LAARVGALEGIDGAADAPVVSDAHLAAELRGAASASFVLVRNERDVLPLQRETLRRVALIGPNAVRPRTLRGGSATVFPRAVVSPLEGLRSALGPHVEIDCATGVRGSTRLAIADPALLRTPDGAADGVEVRLLDADGRLLRAEHRRTGMFTWLGDF